MTAKAERKQKISVNAINHKNVFWPGLDKGMAALNSKPPIPEILDHGLNVDAFFALSGQKHRQHAISLFRRYKQLRLFKSGVSFESAVVEAQNVRISKTIVTVNNKFFFSGASGTRMLVKVSRTNTPQKTKKFEKIATSADNKRSQNAVNLPIAANDARHVNLVITAKNLFNYYHFTVETLPYLTLYREYGLTGYIFIHSDTKRTGDFIKEQIELFFPEIANRVGFQFGDINLSRALVVLDSKFLYFQSRDDSMPSLADLGRKTWLWRDKELDRQSNKTLSMNSYSTPLKALRERVFERLAATTDPSQTKERPKRLYVRRKPDGRLRNIDNEPALMAMLERLGFETVYFEDHDVLEQARLIANAEAIISVHGAGMTNMMYASAGCLVVELSTLQIMMLRLGDFNACALVSQVKYLHFVVDHDWPDQETIPEFAVHSLVGLKISDLAVAQLRGLILEHLEPDTLNHLVETGRMLNDDNDKAALANHLIEHGDRLIHLVDTHVWAASALQNIAEKNTILEHLRQATRLAPMREPLHQRALDLAKELSNTETFDEIASNFFCHMRPAAEAHFKSREWASAPYLQNE